MPTAKIVTYRYSARGPGLFPFDMLRYDRAWPASEADSQLVTATAQRPVSGEHMIALRGLGLPTADRWSSFGWEVSSVKKES